ncbi:peroxide stress protein YaaA [Marinicella sp. S1101]|uniref:peroxide stress protein YaaA n=1 Tax=Marinicella marina TaxID=2996016 RepID=UPI002260B653|nr:peroxide stress protein YaaA [Marinicella marina]MCX7554080.1 peroxide stress protein YaaA [Marinicella marina]MDJ1141227.1 peroxide stress protein YaaA [Marinicella marina]
MLILLSPSKGQDFDQHPLQEYTQPVLLDESEVLAKQLKKYKPNKIAELMSVSENIAELNYERFQSFKTPFKLGVAKQAALAFKGDVYSGLEASEFNADQWQYAQQHLRILSGLYGYLRPLDLIMPYRLEMKTKLNNPKGENLYQFWGDDLTVLINNELSEDDYVVNLASNEYFKAVKAKKLKAPVLNIDFKDSKNGKTRIISFYAKKARGMMAKAIIKNGIEKMADIKDLSFDGYRYREDLSSELKWVYERPQPAPKK